MRHVLSNGRARWSRSARADECVSIASTIPVTDPFGIAADTDLPQARLALDPGAVELELKQLAHFTRTGASVQLCAIRVTRHKPGRRVVLEYDVAVPTATGTREFTLIGKLRARHDARAAYRLLDALWNAGFAAHSHDGISVPEPVGVINHFNLWLQHKVPGRPLGELLSSSASTALARRVADAIHKLHRAGVATEKRHTLTDELRILHENLPRVAQEHPDWNQRLKSVLAACDRLGATLPAPVECGIHRDFYADQVIVDGARLYLLDFDLYCIGDPALDIGNFAGHIIEQSVRLPDDSLTHFEHALVERFVELTGPASRHAVAVYTTLTLVRHIYLSTLFPERRAFTGRLLELCEQRLGASAVGRP